MKNNAGKFQWKRMRKNLNEALDNISSAVKDPNGQVQVETIGLGEKSHAELSVIHKDLFEVQTFDNEVGGWSYRSESFDRLNDLF